MSFTSQLSEIINNGQSRSIVLTGNIDDLFYHENSYIPLINLICKKYDIKANTHRGITLITYEINHSISVLNKDNLIELEKAWKAYGQEETLEKLFERSQGNHTYSLELLRQITDCVRKNKINNNLLIIIEGADFLIPDAEISRLNIADRQRVAILKDWFCNPEFMNGNDTVVLLTESKSLLNNKIARLPQITEVEVSLPNIEQRKHFIDFNRNNFPNLELLTAGLSIHAIRQLLLQKEITIQSIIKKVEEFIQKQVGEGVVEFKKPTHGFDKVCGFKSVKKFMKDEIIPRFIGGTDTALSGVVFSGPIGGGKTYLGEALATELGVPVLLLTGLRSKWFGETDVIIERLQRLLKALDKVVVFIDECDTVFGNLASDEQATEKRLTGKIQAMMSDPLLKGKVFWILMTARIHMLSPDIRRPGRCGDLILPILDPTGEDLDDFFNWMLSSIEQNKELIKTKLREVLGNSVSSALLSSIRSEIKVKKCKTIEDIEKIIYDIVPADIEESREYQTLQSLLNCTRRSLLPINPTSPLSQLKEEWKKRIQQLELQGVK